MPACGPFRRLVILGDSNSYGMCAHDPRNEWNQVLANWLRHFQDEPLAGLQSRSAGRGDFAALPRLRRFRQTQPDGAIPTPLH